MNEKLSETVEQLRLFEGVPEEEVSRKTLSEVREMFVEKVVGKGAICPCCNRFMKLYKRKLYTSMVLSLLLVHRFFVLHKEHKWLHVSNFLIKFNIKRSDQSKLCYWGLLEPLRGERGDGSRRKGLYRITEKGIEFCEGKIRIPKYAYTLRNVVQGYSDGAYVGAAESVDVREALGQKFDYSEVMSRVVS